MGRIIPLRFVLAFTAVVLLLALSTLHPSVPGYSSLRALAGNYKPDNASHSQAFKHSHVIVGSAFGSHFDVYLAFVWTLQRVLGTQGHVSVYSHSFSYGFSDIVERLGLYNGTYNHPEKLIEAVNSTTLYPDEPGAMVDMIVFGTCEIDMKRWSEQLLVIYDSRPADKKFKLVCGVHNAKDTAWQVNITPWARRGAIRILPISEHVAAAFRTKFAFLADNADPETYGSGYEYIPVDVHIPILPLPDPQEKDSSSILSNAVIQGSFTTHRRDYTAIFSDLQEALGENPRAWGYKPLSDSSTAYEPDPSTGQTPFLLHLLGHGELEIPHSITNIIKIHTRLQYSEFYELMHEMDVVIPAFAPRGGYYDEQASSTMAMAVECNTPILVTNHIRAAYTYVADDRITVTRPQDLREINAIKLLRTGVISTPPHLSGVAAGRFEEMVQRMLAQGWRRSNEGFSEVKRAIWRANEDVSRRILNDL